MRACGVVCVVWCGVCGGGVCVCVCVCDARVRARAFWEVRAGCVSGRDGAGWLLCVCACGCACTCACV